MTDSASYRWWALGALLVGTFTVALSLSLLFSATPKIMPDLNASVSDVAWLSIAYALGFSVFQPILGKLADLYGRKRFFIGGLALFTVGAGLASLSWDMFSMALFRFLQGIGAAAVFPVGMAFIGEYFAEDERGKAMGIWGIAGGAGPAIGPTLGGWILDLFGWRAIYQFSVAIGVLSIVAPLFLLRESRRSRSTRIDYAGSLGLFVAAGAALLAVSQGRTWGWLSPATLALFGLSAIGIVGLVLVERRQQEPVIDPGLVRSPLFLAASATAFLSFMAFQGALFLVPFFLMDVQHYGGSQVGLLLLPFFLPMALASPLGGWLSDRLGPRLPTLFGMALSAFALGLLAPLSLETPYWYVAAVSLALGVGIAIALPPLGKAIIGAAPLSKLGAASGIFSVVRSMGGPFGVALLTTVFAEQAAIRGREAFADCASTFGISAAQLGELRRLQGLLQAGSGGATADQLALLRQLGPRLQEAQDCARLQGMLGGFEIAFLVAAGLSLVGVLTAIFVRGVPKHGERLTWTPEAEAVLERVPEPARLAARQAFENQARQRGMQVVTQDVIRGLRSSSGDAESREKRP